MRISYNSPVILTFTLVCLAVVLLDLLTAASFSQVFFALPPFFDPASPLSYLRLFTHIAGHQGLVHFMSNFAIILLIGPILEEKYGSGALMLMIAITALVTAILNLLFFSTGLMGASGIVFMFIVLGSFVNVREKGEIPLTFILVFLIFVAKEFFNALEEDQVSQFAHVLGGVCGAAFGYIFAPDNRRKLPKGIG